MSRTLFFLLLLILQSGCAAIFNGSSSYKGYEKHHIYNNAGQVILTSPLPLGKSYHELTAAQQQVARAYYKNLDENDRPPYPKYGVRLPYILLMDHSRFFQYRNFGLGNESTFDSPFNPIREGNALAIATISKTGDVESVKVLKSTSKNQAKYLEEILHQTEFDPGLCAGEPCQSEYRFQLMTNIWHARRKISYRVYPPKRR